MNLKNTYRTIRTKLKRKPKFNLQSGHSVDFAFRCDGVDYYRFADIFNMGTIRAMSSIMFYEEFKMRMDKDFLVDDTKAHLELNNQLKACLSGKNNNINLQEAFGLLAKSDQLLGEKQRRLEWIFEPETVYKLASVVFFDKSENPYNFDIKYAEKKILKWKQHNTQMLDFFLQQPIMTYGPSFKELKVDLKTYLETIESLSDQHSALVWAALSKKS